MKFFMRFPKGRVKAFTLSYDDGVDQDIRFIDILNKNSLKCTFNINSERFAPEGTVYPEGVTHRIMPKSQVLKTYENSGHEIAIHGATHPFLDTLPCGNATKEIIEDRENLEKMFGTIVRGMAYPYGTYNDTVVEILKNAGIVYARTVKSTHRFDLPSDWLRLPATCHHDDEKLFELTDKFLADSQNRHPMLFYVWGHTYEFERNNNWERFEEFAEKIGGHNDVWYATNIEIYDYVQAFRTLNFSVDMKRVHNPSATELFFEIDGKIHSVKPGETKNI